MKKTFKKIILIIFLLNSTCLLFSQNNKDSNSCLCLIKSLAEKKLTYIIDNTIDERNKLIMPKITGEKIDSISFYNIDTSYICDFENAFIKYLNDSMNIKLNMNNYIRQYLGYKIKKSSITTLNMLVTLNTKEMRFDFNEDEFESRLRKDIFIVMGKWKFQSMRILYDITNNKIIDFLDYY